MDDIHHAVFSMLLAVRRRLTSLEPVKQLPYRHSPVLAAKVQTEIDKFVLAGILRKSYSNWSSPLVVIAKSDGRIRITCNYKD